MIHNKLVLLLLLLLLLHCGESIKKSWVWWYTVVPSDPIYEMLAWGV